MVDRTADAGETSIPNIQCYEDFLDCGDENFPGGRLFDELSASSLF